MLEIPHPAVGVQHGDIKPQNLILSENGVVLVDFGIARLLDEVEQQGTVGIGTPRFMAPEVFAGGNVSPGGSLIIADTFNHRIRTIGLDGRISSFAGTGVGGVGPEALPPAQMRIVSPLTRPPLRLRFTSVQFSVRTAVSRKSWGT